MVKVGSYNRLSILRFLKAGAYLDDGAQGILLPTRFVPPGAKEGQELEVFVYHDSEDRLIATTQKAKACVGEIALLKVVGISPQGAFLDWGLMKDLFVPRSKQLMGMRLVGSSLVKLYIDERTGRVAATEKFENELSNEQLTVKEKDQVQLLTYRRTEIGYVMIINNQHTGLLHFNEIFKELAPGDQLEGFIKEIKPGNKIDLVAGRPGYQRVEEEKDKILALLQDNNGYLPYYDKSAPEEIYAFFGMSKKTFKMATGALYKERKISLEKTGIRLL